MTAMQTIVLIHAPPPYCALRADGRLPNVIVSNDDHFIHFLKTSLHMVPNPAGVQVPGKVLDGITYR